MLRWYDQLEEFIGRVLRTICVLLLTMLLLIFMVSICMRFFPVASSMAWFEEIVTLCFAWMSFLGAAELWRNRSHFTVDFFLQFIKRERTMALVNFVVDLISLLFFIIVAVFSIRWISGIHSTTAALGMPTGVLYSSVPVAMTIMGIMTLRDLLEDVGLLFEEWKGRRVTRQESKRAPTILGKANMKEDFP